MKHGLTKVLVLAMMMTASTHAFAEEVSDLELELGRGKIEATMNDQLSNRERLNELLNILEQKIQGNGDSKVGTTVDAIRDLQTREMSAAEIQENINIVNILINHVDNN